MATALPSKSYARISVELTLPELIEVRLESFKRLKAEGLTDLFNEIVELLEDLRNLVVFVDLDLMELYPLHVHGHLLQLLSGVLLPNGGQLTPLDEVALVVVAVFAAHEDDAVEPGGNRLCDPDRIHRSQAPHGNDPSPGASFQAILPQEIHGRNRIVFAGDD